MIIVTSKNIYERIVDEINTASRAGRVTESIKVTRGELAELTQCCPKSLRESLPSHLGVIPIKVFRIPHRITGRG